MDMANGKIRTGMSIDLLWTNPSPGSNFGAQTISLDLSGYSFVIVFFSFDPQSSVLSQCYLAMAPMGGIGQMMGQVNYRVKRQFTVKATGVAFSSGASASAGGNLGNSDGAAIPQLIYGVRL